MRKLPREGAPEDASALEARLARMLADGVLLPRGSAVLIAVSGGADSVALLRLFCALREEWSLTLYAAHLHHGIRGEAAAEDAAFVSALCERLGVRCILGAWDVPALAAQFKTGLEDAARRARYAFLEEARVQCGAKCIALAHHLEDQAETVLLHLARGCGLSGLTGMRPVSGRLIRPLLGVHRETLRAYLQAIGQDWREDATNADLSLTRNRLRAQAMPALAGINPNLAAGLAGMAERLAIDEAYLLGALAALELPEPKPTPYGACWRIDVLRGAHEALRRRALGEVWRTLTGGEAAQQLEAAHLCALSALLDAGGGASCNLPGGWRARGGKVHLHFLSPGSAVSMTLFQGQAVPLRLSGETPLPGGARIVARQAGSGELGDGLRTQVLDADQLTGAVVRSRREGDRFRPLGALGAQALKQTLIDRGVDQPFRALMPLIAAERRVLWIVGLLPAQDAAVTGRTAAAVHLTYEGAFPWE